MSERKWSLTINELVAFNLAKARKRRGWTQQETANALTRVTGKRYTAVTYSAAECSWRTGRTRQFDAAELVTFAQVFDLPVAAFLLPVEDRDGTEGYTLGPRGGEREGETISARELLGRVLSIRSPAASDVAQTLAVLAEGGRTNGGRVGGRPAHEHLFGTDRERGLPWERCVYEGCEEFRHRPLRNGGPKDHEGAEVCPETGGEHQWQPVSFRFETQLLDPYGRVEIRQPNTDHGRVYMVCAPCRHHTYMETAWVGYQLGGPFQEALESELARDEEDEEEVTS